MKLDERSRQLIQAAGSALAVLDEHLRNLEPQERVRADMIAACLDRIKIAREGLIAVWGLLPRTANLENGRKKK